MIEEEFDMTRAFFRRLVCCMTTFDAPPPPPHTPTRSHFLFVHKRLIRFSAFVRCILLHLCLFGESLWSKSVPSATQILQFTRYTYRSVAMQMQVASIQSYVPIYY